MSQNTQNSKLSTLAPSAKNSKLSSSTKKVITKATKKTKEITIDDKPHYLEEVINNFVDIDFESKYREILFKYNALEEEHSGAMQEIDGLKFQLGDARKNCLKFNDLVTKQEEEIKQLKEQNEDAENRISHLERTIKNIKRKYNQEQDDNQQLIQERDHIQFDYDVLKLTNENLETEIKDLKVYADDCERNFSNLDDENTKILSESEELKENAKADAETIKELEDTITGLQLEKEIICKQNEEISEKLKYFRQETLNQAKRRIDLTAGFEEEIKDLKIAFKELKEKNQELKNHNEKLTDSLDLEYQKSFYGVSEKSEHKEKIKRLEDLIKEKDDSNTQIYNELKDVKTAFNEMKEKNIKLNEGMGIFGRQILDLELKIKKLINMLEEYEALGAIQPSMVWTLQCKLNTFIKPDYKPVKDHPKHIINLGNGEFY